MPDQNQTDPNNPTPVVDPTAPVAPVVPSVDTTVTTSTVPQPSSSTFFPTEDTPPVPAFQTVTTTPDTTTTTTITGSPVQQTTVTEDQPSGSAAPADFPPMTSSPKKKFGGGKIIATILGLFVLIGGVGAGILLTQQNQQFNQNASDVGCPTHHSKDSCNGACSQVDGSGNSYECGWDSGDSSCGKTNKLCGGGGGGGGQSEIVSCSLLNPPEVVQCGVTPSGCGGFCIRVGTTGTCNQMLEQECGTLNRGTCAPDGTANAAYTSNGSCITSHYGGTIYKYKCPGEFNLGGGCQKGEEHKNGGTYCFDDKFCGTEQIDSPDAASCFISKEDRNGCNTSTTPPGPTSTPTPTPTVPGITARCVPPVKAYNPAWTFLDPAQLPALKAGDVINFCVTGSATGGSFDMARFTINGVLQPNTTTKGQGAAAAYFCQNYTIPATTTTFNITAQIHHVTLGWK